MMPRESIGELEHQVMLAILHLDGRAYSVPIVDRLESMVGKSVSPSAVYVALRRLEKRSLVTSEHEPPELEQGGRGKRYFMLTDEGMLVLRESRRVLESLWDGLDPVFGR